MPKSTNNAKKKGNKKKESSENNSSDVVPIHVQEKNQILDSQCQILAEQLSKYKDQSSETAKLATKLKHELRKHDLKTTEMVAYLQNEIHQKDLKIEKLQNANYSLKVRAENHEELKQTALHNLETQNVSNFTAMESSLQSTLETLEREVESLKYVKKNKEEIENALFVAKATMEAQAKKFKLSIDHLESKYIVDVARIRDMSQKEINTLKNRARELAEQELDGQSRNLRIENKKMRQDLSFHASTTSILHKENEQKTDLTNKLKLELQLLKEKDLQQCKQSVSYKQRIKQLTSKLHRLEDTLNGATEEWEKIRQQMLKQFSFELDGYKKQNNALKVRNKTVENTLNSLKFYAKKLINQRSEIEQFFHEALDVVKQSAEKRLQSDYAQEWNEYSETLSRLGLNAESVHDRQIAHDQIGIDAPNKLKKNKDAKSDLDVIVKLEDLTVNEKEHVLKVLISKINTSHQDMEASMMKHQVDIKKPIKQCKAEMDMDEQYNDTFMTQKKTTTDTPRK